MIQFTIRQPAEKNTRFHPNAFDRNVGKEITINMPNGDSTLAKMVFAHVSSDGLFADLGFETESTNIHQIIENHDLYKEQ